MLSEGKNDSIHCSINNCEYHCQSKDYCSLGEIKVGTHESNPTRVECTDCESFKFKG